MVGFRWWKRVPKWWMVIALYRVLQGTWMLRTFFSPDEYWQALEPAFYSAYGYGYLTWEWVQVPLRSPFYPGLFIILFKCLGYMGLTSTSAMILLPKILQSLIAAVGDIYTFYVARRLFNARVARWAMWCSLLSWFHFYSWPRTFINSFETTTCIAACYYWPWSRASAPSISIRSLAKALIIIGATCIARPTHVLFWIIPAMQLCFTRTGLQRIQIICTAMGLAFAMLILSLLIDGWFYGAWGVSSLYTFFQVNLMQSISAFYGVHSWHWYLTQAVPFLLTTYLPVLIYGLYVLWPQRRQGAFDMLFASLGMTFGLSITTSHKEFRFLHPILPVLLIYTAVGADRLEMARVAINMKQNTAPINSTANVDRYSFRAATMSRRKAKKEFVTNADASAGHKGFRSILIGGFILMAQVITALYMSIWHQSGVISVMHHLRRSLPVLDMAGIPSMFTPPSSTYFPEHVPGHTATRPHVNHTTLFFAMPCHSTPFYAYLLRPDVHMDMITCEPPVGLSAKERKTFLGEDDRFYSGPRAFLHERFEQHIVHTQLSSIHPVRLTTWPSVMVFFEQLLIDFPDIPILLQEKGYHESYRAFNSHFHDDHRRQGDVIVYSR